MLTIRAAAKGDEATVLHFIRELAAYERLTDDVIATENDIAAALFAENPRTFCDLAAWNGEWAGFAVWFYNFSTFAGRPGIYLEDIFVKPEFRGRGIGKRLLARLARRALEEGCDRLQWSVLKWNAPSIALFESLGARPADDWTVYRLTGDALARLGRT